MLLLLNMVLLCPSCLVGLHFFVLGNFVMRLRDAFGLEMADNKDHNCKAWFLPTMSRVLARGIESCKVKLSLW